MDHIPSPYLKTKKLLSTQFPQATEQLWLPDWSLGLFRRGSIINF